MAVYGVLLIVGGFIGWSKAHSKWSLITGIGTGILMFIAWGMNRSGGKSGIGLGLAVSIALSLFFLYDVVKHHKPMPGGGMFVISAIVAVLLARAVSQS
jgi:uncharacterized membrane protein (UPF0136 family)